MDKADLIANADRPVVQESRKEDHVELVLPKAGTTVEMHEEVFLEVFGEGMRIITGMTAEEYD